MLFPELSEPTAPVRECAAPPPKLSAGLTMPKRRITRMQARRQRVEAERQRNAPWAERYVQESVPAF